MGSPRHGGIDLGVFVPGDVRAALARGAPQSGGERRGAVLEADVSGFTPLTERLAREHGPHRGAEEVTALLDRVYGALVAEVDDAGGTVVEFAGDAIVCCFDGDDDGLRALRCGVRMQAAIAAVGAAAPSVKVAVATGAFERFSVGDPDVRVFEVIAGPAIGGLIAVSPCARSGEVVVAMATARRLGARIAVADWRTTDGVRHAVVDAVHGPRGDPPDPPPEIDAAAARPWLPAAIFERLEVEGDSLLAELRSVVALFARFDGADAAGPAGLDAYVRHVQAVVEGYGGTLLNLAADAKGSYLSAAFGAPVAHDDDALRAAAAALALRTAGGPVSTAAIGLAAGRMYAGTYGGRTRKTFGLQGDRLNVAARLMQAAGGGRILVEEPLAARLQRRFELRAPARIAVKGRSSPVAVRELAGPRRDTPATHARAAPELVDRDAERRRLQAAVDALRSGRGGVIVLEGEPGIGKSRLVTHLAELAAAAHARVFVGAGDPIERSGPYHGWRAIFGDALGLGSPSDGPRARGELALERLAAVLATGGDGARAELAPLLSAVAPLALPDSPETAGLTGEARGEATRDLLAATLAALARERPTLVVLEDAHWLDSASLALALRVASAPGGLLLVLTTRPIRDTGSPDVERIARLPGCEHLAVGPLPAADAGRLARNAAGVRLATSALAQIETASGGNPLFARELALALRDRGAEGPAPLSADGVEAVIAERIDRVPSAAQGVLKIASVLGLAFSSRALDALAGDGAAAQVQLLERLDLLALDPRDGAAVLRFRHALIREVVYGRLLHAQRRALHRAAAELLEADGGDHATAAALAHHWDRAEAPERAAAHYGSSGEAALRAGAARECAEALTRALELTSGEEPGGRRAGWMHGLSQAHYRLGAVHRSITAGAAAIAALDRPVPARDRDAVAAVLREVAGQLRRRLRHGRVGAAAVDPLAVEALFAMGEIYYAAGDKTRSLYVALRSLNLAEDAGPSAQLAVCRGAMCIISGVVGAHPLARRYADLAQATAAAVDDPYTTALTAQQVAWYRSSVGPHAAFCDGFADAIARFDALAHKPRLRDSLGCAGIGDLLFGRHAEAERKLTTLLAGVEPQERAIWVQWAPLFLAAVALRRGAAEQAVERLTAIDELGVEVVDQTRTTLLSLLALALWRSGREGDARRCEAAAWRMARRLGRRPTNHAELVGRAALAELALARWDAAASPAARRRARRAARQAGTWLQAFARVFPVGMPARLLYAAELDARRGRRRRALRGWRRCLAAAERLDARHELALAHAALAERLAAGSPAAVEHRRLAAAGLADVGAPPWLRAVAARRPAPAQADDDALARLAALVERWRARDSPAGYFAAVQTHVAVAVAAAAARDGFDDPARVVALHARLVARYGAACERPQDAPAAWRLAFESAARGPGDVVTHVALAMSAHVLVDLPVALAEVLGADPPHHFGADVERLNALAADVVAAAVAGVAGGRRGADLGLRAERARAWSRALELATLDAEARDGAVGALDDAAVHRARAIGRPRARRRGRRRVAPMIADLGVPVPPRGGDGRCAPESEGGP